MLLFSTKKIDYVISNKSNNLCVTKLKVHLPNKINLIITEKVYKAIDLLLVHFLMIFECEPSLS